MPSFCSGSGRLPVTLLLLGVLGVLAGCNPLNAPQSLMDEYVERTARVLDQPFSLSLIPSVEPLPRRRDRMLDMPDVELGMLGFLSLFGCELQMVAGERASVLGRVMQPANRLRYEVRFIQTAEACLPDISDEALAEDIGQAIGSKRNSLPIAIWNATWGVEEIENLFSLSEGLFPLKPDPGQANLTADLGWLNHQVDSLLNGELQVNLAGIGTVHQQWQAHSAAGQLLRSAEMVITRLDDASDVLEARLQDRPLCLDGKPNNQSEIVRSMFFSVFVERVQPYLARIRRGRDEIIRPLGQLAALQADVMPTGFRRWFQRYLIVEGERLWQRLDASQERHIDLWQRQLEQCGLRPGT